MIAKKLTSCKNLVIEIGVAIFKNQVLKSLNLIKIFSKMPNKFFPNEALKFYTKLL